MSARLGRQRRAGSHRCLATLAAAKADGPALALGRLSPAAPAPLGRLCGDPRPLWSHPQVGSASGHLGT